MRGETDTHRDAVMLSEATWQAARGVRTPEWKYIRFLQTTIYGRDGVELYDLANDPHEQVNVADAHPEVVEELGARLNHWVSAQLGGRPDPMHSVLDAGLPAVARLNDVIAGLTRPRNDVPTPAEPSPEPSDGSGRGETEVLVGAGLAAASIVPSDHLDPLPGDGGRFAPRNPHRRRLRGARGVVVGVLVLGAAALLGAAVNDLLLSSSLSAAGVVQPALDAQLNMPTTGTISSIPVHVGELVHAGQVLASQDTSALDADLAADEAKLTADQTTLAQEQAGGQATQVQQLQDQVAAAQAALATAQQKLSGTTATSDAAVAAAQATIRTDQALLASDQQTYQDDIPECVSATPPASCGSDQRQVQVDQGNLTADQNALDQARPPSSPSSTRPRTGSTRRRRPWPPPRLPWPREAHRPRPNSSPATSAAIQQDEAAIASDRAKLADAVVTAPFDGVVTAVNGTVGEVVTSQGVRQATAAQSLPQGTTTGIQLFPQGPQSGTASSPSSAALITLDSVQNQMVVQVPETAVSRIHTGQNAPAPPFRPNPAPCSPWS